MSEFISGMVGVVFGVVGLWAAMAGGLVSAPGRPAAGLLRHPAAEAAPTGVVAPRSAVGSAERADADVAAPAPQSPAYLIVLGDVHDRETFIPGYAQKMPPIYAKYGGEYLAVGRNREVLEGDGAFTSYVISRWPSMDAARAFWSSTEYEPLKRARIDGSWGTFDVYLVEGVPAAAPPAE